MARPINIPNRRVVVTALPKNDLKLINEGLALHQKGRLVEAAAIYEKILAKWPSHIDALYLRGIIANENQNPTLALELFNKALALNSNFADALNNRGIALQQLGRPKEALLSYEKAVENKPNFAAAFNNLGNVYQELRQLQDSIASYAKAMTLQPDMADAFNNCGNVLNELNRRSEAMGCFNKAISINPNNAEAFYNRGNLLIDLNRLDEAFVNFQQAIKNKPDYDFLFGLKLNTQMKLCDWTNLSAQCAELEVALVAHRRVSVPFPVLALIDRLDIQLLAAQIFTNAKYPESQALGDCLNRVPDGKIRIGYYSADFHNHATVYLMAELFDSHNSEKFEIYAFSFGPDKQDAMRDRVSNGVDHFFEVTNKTDLEISKMSRELGIDIAVDLKGYTQDARTGIFAERCAPIQVSYLGYPGTMAATYMDYIVADRTLIAPEDFVYYAEKVVQMPNSYQVNDSKRKISSKNFTKQEVGLPERSFVFCCFNNNYKISPETFDGWVRILKAVEGSVLWLLEDNPTAASNLRKEAEIRGLDSSRLIFASRMDADEHLARHQLADLFLDTLPYNAHTTTSDALWAGLPVLTLKGHSFAGRVAASLLNAVNLPELITNNQEEYEAKAIELAKNPEMLAEIQLNLAKTRFTSSLFNGQLFTQHIETAFTAMYQRNQEGLKPEHIYL